MSNVIVCAFECADAGSDLKFRKIRQSLIPFMTNCVLVEGSEESVDDSRLDENGYLIG